MARSSYVYVVLNDEGLPSAGFTVKRELVSYLRRLGPDVDLVPAVIRLPDGREREQATELNIKELVSE
ncbi:hypothetical protein [Micromonospora sp. GCM10011541]|uniref:hypothetical protein n=1 Tax=Micromonospora sp. GCM10011541 TaxID=3317336 RepID=UPI0036127D8B